MLLSISRLDFGADESSREHWDATSSAWVTTDSLFQVTGTTSWSYQIPEASVLEGTYVVTSHAVDVVGNVETTYTITIVYDKTIPEVLLNIDPSSANGRNGWYIIKPTVTLTANDNYNVNYIQYKWNSTDNWTTYTGSITPPGEGQSILYYRSVDTVGNISDIGIKEVKFDATAPTDGAGNLRVENIGDTTADAKWDKPANANEIDSFVIEWKHTDGTMRGTSTPGDVYETKLFDLFNGEWEVTLYSLDAAGNRYKVTEFFTVGGSSQEGNVLGTTDEVTGTGTGGTYTYGSNSSDKTTEEKEEKKIDKEEIVTDGSGEVLGDSDTSCSTWKFYIPLFLLLIQTMFAVSLEIANREPNAKKLLFALALSGLMLGAFYVLRDPECYSSVKGVIPFLAKWFIPISVGLAFLFRGVGSMTVEEK